MGVPYRHQGRSERSLDCLGLLLFAANDVGLMPVTAGRRNYGRAPLDELLDRIPDYCDRLERAEVGAVILVKWPGDKRAGHVAICAGETMIHCYSNAGKVVEHGYRGHWLRWTDSVWWIRGLERG
jgi:cell wall-associated NlpC family hydrolase